MTDLVPITPAGAERLKKELKHLKEVERPANSRAIEAARELGDISDSGDYRAAKEKIAFVEGRILQLESKISRFQVIDPSRLSGSRVVFGAHVTVADPESGDETTYQLVGEDEGDVKQGLISIAAPLARALIGKEEGDECTIRTPKGTREVEIVAVEFK